MYDYLRPHVKDDNPDGRNIADVYRYGSRCGALESSRYAIGDIVSLGIHPGDLNDTFQAPLFPFTARDSRLMPAILARAIKVAASTPTPPIGTASAIHQRVDALKVMIRTKKKGDIEKLRVISLTEWIRMKIDDPFSHQ